MSKSNVNPNHYKVAGRERQGEDIAQIRNKQMLAESLVRRRYEPDARFQKPAPVHDTVSPPATPTRGPEKKTTKTTRAATPKRAPAKRATPKRATAKQARKRKRAPADSLRARRSSRSGKPSR